MEYRKTVRLKDGRTCTLRSACPEEAQAVLDNFRLTHAETDFLTTRPGEITTTLEQERAYLRAKAEDPREIELVADVGGVIAGTAGIGAAGKAEKLRHRASFGISVARAWWGLGIGRALTEACAECARAAGYAQLELEAVAENERALALYRGAGFGEYGRNPRGFSPRPGKWQELVLMRLPLDGRE